MVVISWSDQHATAGNLWNFNRKENDTENVIYHALPKGCKIQYQIASIWNNSFYMTLLRFFWLMWLIYMICRMYKLKQSLKTRNVSVRGDCRCIQVTLWSARSLKEACRSQKREERQCRRILCSRKQQPCQRGSRNSIVTVYDYGFQRWILIWDKL